MKMTLRLILAGFYLSLLSISVHGNADVKTQKHAICSDFSISASDKYVDTGLSLSKVSADNRQESVSKLQAAVISAAGNLASGEIASGNVIGETSTKDLDTTKIEEYARSLVLFVIPGVIILIFSFIGALPILVTRCFMPQKCCKPKKQVPAPEGDASLPKNERKGYTCVETATPVISYAILAGIVLAFAVVGIASAGTILQGMTDSMCSLETLLGDLNVFMTDLSGGINNVSSNGVDLLDKVATKVNITSDLQLRVDGVVNSMAALVDWLSKQSFEGPDGATYDYDLTSIRLAQQSILSSQSSSMQQLADSQKMVLDKLVQPRAFLTNILEMTAMATNSTAKMLTQANDLLQEKPINLMQIPFLLPEGSYKGVMGVTAELRGSSLIVGAVFFSLVLLTIPFNVLGIVCMKCCKGKSGNCCGLFITRCSCVSLFFSMTLVAILGLVLLPVSIVFSDTCILMRTLPQDVRTYAKPFLEMEMAKSPSNSESADPSALVDLSMETGLRVVDACWEDRNLMDALNLTSLMDNYVGKVNFSDFNQLSMDPEAMFKGFYEYQSELAALGPENFEVLNLADIKALEQVCNTCTGFSALPYERIGVTKAEAAALIICDNKCADMSVALTGQEIYGQCRAAQAKSCEVGQQLRKAYDHVTDVAKEATTRYNEMGTLVDELVKFIGTLTQDLHDTRREFEPFAASVSGIKKYGTCHFAVEFFDRTHNAMCASGSPSTLSGMLWFASALAIVPLFSIGLMVSTMCINCRLGGIGQPEHDHLRDIRDRVTRKKDFGNEIEMPKQSRDIP